MDSQKLDMFLAFSSSKFPPERMMEIRNRLEKIDDNRFMFIQTFDFKDPTTLMLVSFFAGGIGIDRFMLGDTGLGVAKLILTVFCFVGFIWVIIDWFTVMDRTREYNYKKLMQFVF